GDSLVGNRTSESGDVSFALTDSCRTSLAKTFGPGSATGLGGGALSTLALFGTDVSTDPVSSFPVRGAGGIGVPSFGRLRGPPGPLAGPMLLSTEPPLVTSAKFTAIGMSTGGVARRSPTALKTMKRNSAWRMMEEKRNGLRNREVSPVFAKA